LAQERLEYSSKLYKLLQSGHGHLVSANGCAWIGCCLAGLTWGKVTDVIGRRPALFWAAIITIVAIVLQTTAQNIAMFVVARILIGFGTSASGLSGPVYLAETLPFHWRGWGLGIFNDCCYVGR
jgi:MFS family permease